MNFKAELLLFNLRIYTLIFQFIVYNKILKKIDETQPNKTYRF
jgi:hypothetical protein